MVGSGNGPETIRFEDVLRQEESKAILRKKTLYSSFVMVFFRSFALLSLGYVVNPFQIKRLRHVFLWNPDSTTCQHYQSATVRAVCTKIIFNTCPLT
jgi:hypothetical protein